MSEEELMVPASWLAEMCSISVRRVHQLAADGVFVRVAHGRYDASQSIQNYARLLERHADDRSQSTSATRLQDRKTQWLELAIAREERELIHINEADAGMQEVCGAILDEVDAIGRQVARDLGKDRADRDRICGIVSDGKARLEQRFAKVREKLRTGRMDD